MGDHASELAAENAEPAETFIHSRPRWGPTFRRASCHKRGHEDTNTRKDITLDVGAAERRV